MKFFERAGNAIFEYGLMLPATLTESSQSRVVRFLGFLGFLVWFFPAGMVIILPLLVCLFGTIFEEIWN